MVVLDRVHAFHDFLDLTFLQMLHEVIVQNRLSDQGFRPETESQS